jgi:predicted DCC family thiol-disulfide oxidoreductase YuxK
MPLPEGKEAMPNPPAPFLMPTDTAVLFDGVCKLCNGWARFIIRHDRHRRLKLASVQSAEGQALLAWAGLPLDHFDTVAVIEDNCVYLRTAAILRILARLPYPWPLLGVARLIPAFLRDWAYDRVARNRYRLFGRYDQCLLPSPDHAERFIKAT